MAAAEKPKRKKARSGRRRMEAAHELATELQALRSALQVMLRRYELNVGGQLDALIERAQGGDTELEEKPRLPTLRQMEAARQALSDLNLKPEKGRAKEFGRLERAVAALDDLLEQ